ncbi:MAG: YihY/virulence factor BrkB family protein [Bacteroidota bacterium]
MIKSFIERAKYFITREIWRIDLDDHSPRKTFLIRQLRIIVIAVKGMLENNIQLRASALTYFSLLSIVPVLAMFFGIAKGFGLDEMLEKQLMREFSGQEKIFEYVIKFANRYLEAAQGGVIAGVGLVVLFFSVMKVIGNIEESFNIIWQIKKGRPFIRKFTDYLTIFLIAPLLMILSSSVTVFITSQVETITKEVALLGYVSPFIHFLLGLIPYVIVWLAFTLMYIIMPNTKVNFGSGFIAGIIAGSFFQVIQWVYINVQFEVSRIGAIYGGFVALPLFLIWMQISWLIVLFGAEISFANQNVKKYEFESGSLNISHYFRRILTLYIAQYVVKNFAAGKNPVTASRIASTLNMPIRIVRDIIFDLINAGIFVETVTESIKENGYHPALDIHKIDVKMVLENVEKTGTDDLQLPKKDELEKLSRIQEDFFDDIAKSPSNKLLMEI